MSCKLLPSKIAIQDVRLEDIPGKKGPTSRQSNTDGALELNDQIPFLPLR